MNEIASKKTVLVSVALLAVIAVYRSTRAGGSDQGSLYKRLWGIGVIGVVLSIAADFVPAVAGPFALVTLLGSLTNGGDRAIQNALSTVSEKIPHTGYAGPSPHAGSRLPPGPGMTPPGRSGDNLNPAR